MLAILDLESASQPSSGGDSVRHIARVAELTGVRTLEIPRNFNELGPQRALCYLPHFQNTQDAVWVGFMMDPDTYQQLYDILLDEKNIRLINDPAQHLLSEEFDRFYPHIEDLTATSRFLSDPTQCQEIGQQLGYPLFVKGCVQSLKIEGPKSCFVNSLQEFQQLCQRLLNHQSRSRGRLIARQLLPLQSLGRNVLGLPSTREFRAFLLHGELLALGFYWPEVNELANLDRIERQAVENLSKEVAKRLKVPYLAVDIGQLKNGRWVVIEVGDAQFAGVCQISPFKIWNALCQESPEND